jgi:molybdopterin-containing oxidoreductase family iron-sulfur binding subunit
MNRRGFLTAAGGSLLAGGAAALGVFEVTRVISPLGEEREPVTGVRRGMVIDLRKCRPGCGDACLKACRKENNVAFHGDKRWDIHWIRKVFIRSATRASTPPKDVPVLCNHCDDPPCAQVCPVQATYKRADGIVIVDHHRCIGCRYCMIACPYGVRFFNYKENPDWPTPERPRRSHGVAESCTMCAHRLDRNAEPACVEACPNRALIVGDLDDPTSDVSRLIATHATTRLREDLMTEPKVYYIGL